MSGPSFTRIRNQSCGDGGRRIRNSSLRRSLVRRTLMELPEYLDETYERILKEIKKSNRAHARWVLQCLVIAIRPLRVTELAEVLAVDFDDAEGIPRLKPD
ncbi:hypothetical protein F5888DRAFT_259557 [Russula emetica]|nr:hypothetical protein F5888DRAFT_259557 [Russula emetica]